MMFGHKKKSAIDRRLDELQREMAKVGTELKTLARQQPAGGNLSGAKLKESPVAGWETEAPSAPAPDMVPDQADGTDDLLFQEQKSGNQDSSFPANAGGRDGEGDLPLFEQRSPLSMPGREKFANYFMAGHFANLRPLRQEKRIVRNKAIIMIVLVVLALIWLLFSLHNR